MYSIFSVGVFFSSAIPKLPEFQSKTCKRCLSTIHFRWFELGKVTESVRFIEENVCA